MQKLRFPYFYFLLCLMLEFASLSAIVPWSLPNNISSILTYAVDPQVKINDKGKGVAVWRESISPINTVLRASIFDKGLWSDPATINPPKVDQFVLTRNFDVALNQQGVAIVVWEEGLLSGPTTIRAARLIKNLWKNTNDVAFLPTTTIADPHVAIDSKGNAIVILLESLVPGARIQVSALPFKAMAWSTPLTVSNGETTTSQPRIAVGEKDDFVGIWIGDAILRAQPLFFSAIVKNHLHSSIVNLSNADVFPDTPVISSHRENHAVVVWTERSLTQPLENSSIQTRGFHFERYKIDHLSPIVTLADDSSSNTNPDVAINQHGRAIAAWQSTSDSINSFIFASVLKEGNWNPKVIISDQVFPFALMPKVGMDRRGNAVAVWQVNSESEFSLSLNSIQSNTYHKGRWRAPFQLSFPSDIAFSPQVSTNNSGKTIAIWSGLSIGKIIQASYTTIRH